MTTLRALYDGLFVHRYPACCVLHFCWDEARGRNRQAERRGVVLRPTLADPDSGYVPCRFHRSRAVTWEELNERGGRDRRPAASSDEPEAAILGLLAAPGAERSTRRAPVAASRTAVDERGSAVGAVFGQQVERAAGVPVAAGAFVGVTGDVAGLEGHGITSLLGDASTTADAAPGEAAN